MTLARILTEKGGFDPNTELEMVIELGLQLLRPEIAVAGVWPILARKWMRTIGKPNTSPLLRTLLMGVLLLWVERTVISLSHVGACEEWSPHNAQNLCRPMRCQESWVSVSCLQVHWSHRTQHRSWCCLVCQGPLSTFLNKSDVLKWKSKNVTLNIETTRAYLHIL